MKFRERWRCSHPLLRGIYGDKINYVGGYRLECLYCGRLLDGPVEYIRRNEIWQDIEDRYGKDLQS